MFNYKINRNLVLFSLLMLLSACPLDNKKGGDYTYSIIQNTTDKEIVFKAYKEDFIEDSFIIEANSSIIDTAYNGNGKQFSYAPRYFFSDSIALIFDSNRYLYYTRSLYNQTEFNLINGKNILKSGWENINYYSNKKFTYTTQIFTLTENDYLETDSL